MKLANPLRFTLSTLGCLVLAIALAAQTAGVVLTHKEPVMAAMLFPLNGAAQEQVSAAIFSSSIAMDSEPEHSARIAKNSALTAYRKEPLSPEAHAILALAQKSRKKRSRLIEIASELDRREPTLQALVLQEHVQAKSYASSVRTLDEILRVRPARSAELFPVLLSVFVQPGAASDFVGVLDGTSPWHNRFVNFAVNQPSALKNLVELRYRVDFQDLKFDQALIRNLVRQGELEYGYDFYNRLVSGRSAHSGEENSGWTSTYGPFDWRLTEDSDFRAQPGLDGNELELYVKPGNGGVFAERILEVPAAPFRVEVNHSIVPRGVAKDVQIELRCISEAQAFVEQEFDESPLGISVKNVPKSCRFMEVSLHARAWSGRSALRGSIQPLVIE